MNITLKEIPADLHQKLRQRADTHGRSLNKEVIIMLETMVKPRQRRSRDLLKKIVERRDSMDFIVKAEELKSIIEEGRA